MLNRQIGADYSNNIFFIPPPKIELGIDRYYSFILFHVSGIAAGADHSNDNIYYGVAGEADIVLVSYIGYDTDVIDGIKYIYDYASSVGKP